MPYQLVGFFFLAFDFCLDDFFLDASFLAFEDFLLVDDFFFDFFVSFSELLLVVTAAFLAVGFFLEALAPPFGFARQWALTFVPFLVL